MRSDRRVSHQVRCHSYSLFHPRTLHRYCTSFRLNQLQYKCVVNQISGETAVGSCPFLERRHKMKWLQFNLYLKPRQHQARGKRNPFKPVSRI